MADAADTAADEASAPRVAAALRYRGGMSAPVVTAKGRGPVADEIVRRAGEHGVAIHVSNNLAAMLMQVDIDRAIPPQLFEAVAQLLAWLYQLEGRAARPLRCRMTASTNSDFALHHRADILAIVDQMQRERTLVTVEFADGHAIVSSVLEVRRDTGALVIDIALDAEQNRRLFASQGLHCVAELDHVQVAFETGPASSVVLADGPAALVDLPGAVVRLQRREWFRAPLPVQPPIHCTVLSADGASIPGQAIDLSPGGAGLLVTDFFPEQSVLGMQRDLILSLPEVGRLALHATLRTVTTIVGATDGLPKLRMGFRFDALPSKTEYDIQRYVQRVEVNQLRLLKRRE